MAQPVEILLLSVAIYYGYLYFRGTRGAKVLDRAGHRLSDADPDLAPC